MGTTSDEAIATLLREARGHLGRRQFDLAVDSATQAIRLDPRRSAPYLIRAEALRRLKKPDRALADLALAARIDPDRAAPYVIRARIFMARSTYDQAIADATQAIFLDPNNAAAFSIRASCRQLVGDPQGAAEDQEELFRIDPTRPAGIEGGPSPIGLPGPDGQTEIRGGGAPGDVQGHPFADRRPVDRTYRARPVVVGDSRPAVSDEEAPEALGVASSYKPGCLPRALPRGRKRGRVASSGGLRFVIPIFLFVVALGFGMFMVGGPSRTGGAPRPLDVGSTQVRSPDSPPRPDDDRVGSGPMPGVVTTGERKIPVASPGPPRTIVPPHRPAAASEPPKLAEGRPKPIQIHRVQLAMTKENECHLLVDTRDGAAVAERPPGRPAKVAGLEHAKVSATDDGTFRATYSFGEVGSMADFASIHGRPSDLQGVSIDKASGVLLMTPVHILGFPAQDKKAYFGFPRPVTVPVSATFDFEDLTRSEFLISTTFEEGTLNVECSPKSLQMHRQEEGWLVAYYWTVGRKRVGKPTKTTLLDVRLEPDKLADYGLSLPVGPSRERGEGRLDFRANESGPIKLRRIEVEAVFPPSFGSDWATDRMGPRVKSVTKGGPSERAGLKAGDTLVSMDGVKPADVPDLLRRLDRKTIGQETKFIVKRAGQEKRIVVKGE